MGLGREMKGGPEENYFKKHINVNRKYGDNDNKTKLRNIFLS